MGFDGTTAAVVGLVVGLTVAAILSAFLIPVGVNQIVAKDTTNLNQDVNEEIVLQDSLNGTLTDIAAVSLDANVTLSDSDTGESKSLVIPEGENRTATLDTETITVTHVQNVDSDTAELTYEYPTVYGWSDGGKQLWRILDMAIVLGLFMMLVGMALVAKRKVA